jgi:hypothetical protein
VAQRPRGRRAYSQSSSSSSRESIKRLSKGADEECDMMFMAPGHLYQGGLGLIRDEEMTMKDDGGSRSKGYFD